MSVALLPIALVLIFFSWEVMLLWTGDPAIAEKSYLLVSLLTVGTALNGLMNVPYALQLAHGWTKLAFYGNCVAIIILGPAVVLLATHFGAVGAAWVWVVLNAGYVLISLRFMHSRLLPGEQGDWYLRDVGLPLGGGLIAVSLARVAIPAAGSKALLCGSLALAGLVCQGATLVTVPWLRNAVVSRLRRSWG